MRIKLYPLLALLFGSISLVSCIDEQETSEAIFLQDKADIEAFVDTTSLAKVKEYKDEANAYYILWQELSNSTDPLDSVYVGDTVSVHYTGKFLSGQVFDTSVEQVARDNNLYNSNYNYLPLQFRVGANSVLLAFEYGIAQMVVGDKATIIMPSELGYGRNGTSGIPPNTPLVFEVELMAIKPGAR